MKQKAIQEVRSFQQKVQFVDLNNGSSAYAKKIVSDYSWWTFNDTDIFQREMISYKLLEPAELVPTLVEIDQANKQFMVKAVATVQPKGKQVQPFLDGLLTLLCTLREILGQEFQACSARHLQNLYYQKGETARVSLWLLDEMVAILRNWEKYESQPLSYVHGDLHFGNVLYDGECIRLIDFEEAIQSHPVFDAASLSWDVMDQFGPRMYDYFRRLYQQAFRDDLIDLTEWKRFCKLRDWIVGRYVDQCCGEAIKEKAHKFILDTEPYTAG